MLQVQVWVILALCLPSFCGLCFPLVSVIRQWSLCFLVLAVLDRKGGCERTRVRGVDKGKQEQILFFLKC